MLNILQARDWRIFHHLTTCKKKKENRASERNLDATKNMISCFFNNFIETLTSGTERKVRAIQNTKKNLFYNLMSLEVK